LRASMVAAEMTEFIPGAGPPPHKIPSFTPSSFQQQGDPDKRPRESQKWAHDQVLRSEVTAKSR
jgi:hypothetical protein